MKAVNFSFSLKPTDYDVENGLVNIYVERSGGALPETLFVEAEIVNSFSAYSNYGAKILTVKDAESNPIPAHHLRVVDDSGTSLPYAIELMAVEIYEKSELGFSHLTDVLAQTVKRSTT